VVAVIVVVVVVVGLWKKVGVAIVATGAAGSTHCMYRTIESLATKPAAMARAAMTRQHAWLTSFRQQLSRTPKRRQSHSQDHAPRRSRW
jgi:hypothetical protein